MRDEIDAEARGKVRVLRQQLRTECDTIEWVHPSDAILLHVMWP